MFCLRLLHMERLFSFFFRILCAAFLCCAVVLSLWIAGGGSVCR